MNRACLALAVVLGLALSAVAAADEADGARAAVDEFIKQAKANNTDACMKLVAPAAEDAESVAEVARGIVAEIAGGRMVVAALTQMVDHDCAVVGIGLTLEDSEPVWKVDGVPVYRTEQGWKLLMRSPRSHGLGDQAGERFEKLRDSFSLKRDELLKTGPAPRAGVQVIAAGEGVKLMDRFFQLLKDEKTDALMELMARPTRPEHEQRVRDSLAAMQQAVKEGKYSFKALEDRGYGDAAAVLIKETLSDDGERRDKIEHVLLVRVEGQWRALIRQPRHYTLSPEAQSDLQVARAWGELREAEIRRQAQAEPQPSTGSTRPGVGSSTPLPMPSVDR